MCEHLEAQTRGRIRDLIINVPPRTSKSTIVSVMWPAWEWTVAPHQRYLCASYTDSLALDLSLSMRRVVESDWYQGLWGDRVQLADDKKAAHRFDTTERGYRISTSFGGAVLGKGGGRVIIDDPHNVRGAESDVQRESVITTWKRAFANRGNDPKRFTRTLTMQRLNEGDLSGYLLESGGWEHLMLPMEFEPERRCRTSIGWVDPRTEAGELLQPERFGPAEIKERKKAGTYAYAGQEQQRPSPAEGGMFKAHWWKRFRHFATPPVFDQSVVMAPARWDRKIISVDAAFKGGDKQKKAGSEKAPDRSNVCLQTIATSGAYKYVLNCRAEQMDIMQTIQAILEFRQADPDAYAIIIEDKANGPAIVQLLKNKIPGVMEVAPKGDKVARAMAMQPQVEAGQVFLLYGAAWVEDYIDEFKKFPTGKRNDRVDTLSQAVIWLDDPAHSGGDVITMASMGLG